MAPDEVELPKNWKNHAQLDITLDEYIALGKVYQVLSVMPDDDETSMKVDDAPIMFSMNYSYMPRGCGTVMCIGGHVKLFMLGCRRVQDYGTVIANYVHEHRSQALYDLYFPYNINITWDYITHAMAVEAIDNFMRTGSPLWRSIEGTMFEDDDDIEDEEEDIDA